MNVVGESKAAFELKLPSHWRIHPIFHASLLDHYRANKIGGREQLLSPLPDIVNGELEYEIGRVLDSRVQRNKLQYLVGWKGYSLEERTWEPVENLENAKEAVATFYLCHLNRLSATDLKGSKPRRSSAHRRGGTVMNDSEPREPHGPGDRGPSGVQVRPDRTWSDSVRPGSRTGGHPV